jgi:protein-S-isoprenylcysteine O-methyltransferase Ste14
MADSEARNLRDHSGVFFPPPLLYAIIFIVGVLLQRVWPVRILPPPVGRTAGIVCIVAGVTLIVWSIQTFWRARTSILPVRPSTAIVTGGPFRFTRNPMYVALALLYLGAAFWLNMLWLLLLFPALIFLVQFYVIAREERYLERKFGEEYLQYKSRVRRWM